MTLPLNPPPVNIPSEFTRNPSIGGFFDALLRTVYLLWAEVQGREFSQKTTTTDATPTALQTVSTVLILARVLARRTGGSAGSAGDSASYVISGTFKNIAGIVSQVGSGDTVFDEDQAGWDCGFSINGTQVSVVGTGAVNNNNPNSFQSSLNATEALLNDPAEMQRQGFTRESLQNTLDLLRQQAKTNPVLDARNIGGIPESQRSLLANNLASPGYGNFENEYYAARDQEVIRRRAEEESSGVGAVFKTVVPLGIGAVGGMLGGAALGLGATGGGLFNAAGRGAIGGTISSGIKGENLLSGAAQGAGLSALGSLASQYVSKSGLHPFSSVAREVPSAESLVTAPTVSSPSFLGRLTNSMTSGMTKGVIEGITDMNPFTLLAGGALLGGTIYASNKQASAAEDAARQQAQSARAGMNAQERMLDRQIAASQQAQEQISQRLQPFVDVGTSTVGGLTSLVNDPNAQSEYITGSPFYQSLANDAQNRIFANQAARGKLGSGETAKALQDSLVALGSDLLNQSIQQRQNLATLGSNAAAGQATGIQNSANNIVHAQGHAGNTIANLLLQQGNAQAAGTVGAANAGAQGLNNLVNTALAAYGLSQGNGVRI